MCTRAGICCTGRVLPLSLRNAARGKSSLGEKTVLDGLDAQVRALEATPSGTLIDVALKAAKDTVEEFTQKPNQAGRARIFAEKSIGLPDPGQLALMVITEGLR